MDDWAGGVERRSYCNAIVLAHEGHQSMVRTKRESMVAGNGEASGRSIA